MSKGSDKRIQEIPASRDGKNGRTTRPASVAPAKPSGPPPARAPNQLQLFENAVRLFHARKFREARDLFQQALAGANRTIAHNAELHVRMCERRLSESPVAPKTLEEHYTYGVALINSRDLEGARRHLQTALAMDSHADHVLYALALCQALSGDLQSAYENLKRAIDLQPRNRIAARQDADFAGIANQPPLDRLLYPEKKSY